MELDRLTTQRIRQAARAEAVLLAADRKIPRSLATEIVDKRVAEFWPRLPLGEDDDEDEDEYDDEDEDEYDDEDEDEYDDEDWEGDERDANAYDLFVDLAAEAAGNPSDPDKVTDAILRQLGTAFQLLKFRAGVYSRIMFDCELLRGGFWKVPQG